MLGNGMHRVASTERSMHRSSSTERSLHRVPSLSTSVGNLPTMPLSTVSTQLDLFSPAYASPLRKSEIWHGVLTLVATIVGGGTLSVPWAVAQAGVALGLGTLVLLSAFAALSVHFLLSSARRYGGLRSYEEVTHAAMGRWAKELSAWSVVITCFMTLCANQILLRQLVVPLAAAYVLHRPLSPSEELMLGGGLVAAVVPLTYLTTLRALRHVSLLSVGSVCVLVLVIAYKGFFDCKSDAPPAGPIAPVPPVPLASINFISAIPVMICVYLCSFSALPLDTELRDPTRGRMDRMIGLAFATALMLYVVAGAAGIEYGKYTGQEVPSNVLLMFR